MNYFLVFQNKTFKEERAGGYLWAPKTNEDGRTFPHWTMMTQVQKGDIIFNSYQGEMASLIIAMEDCKDSPIPDSLDSVNMWQRDGWMVQAKYVDVPGIRYKDHMDRILELQGDKYAPYNVSGRGNTGYLFKITPELADYFFSVLNVKPSDLVEDESADAIIEKVEQEANEEPIETVREQVVQSRVGQGLFKQRLSKLDCKCKLCGLNNMEFLRASHSKPWSKSTNQERLDQYNGFLFCPAHDSLYDKGYISFNDDGTILISAALDPISKTLMNVHAQMKVSLLEGHKPYLQYHRAHIFKA